MSAVVGANAGSRVVGANTDSSVVGANVVVYGACVVVVAAVVVAGAVVADGALVIVDQAWQFGGIADCRASCFWTSIRAYSGCVGP